MGIDVGQRKFGVLAPVAHKVGHNKGMEIGIGIVRHFRRTSPMNLMPWGFFNRYFEQASR